MSDELRQALIDEVTGVGEATADTIMEIVAEHTADSENSRYLDKAKQAADRGDDREAAIYLRRANE
jgi:uncharacterized protein HemY